MHPTAIAQLTHSDESFAHLAANFVREVRRKLCVPDHADHDVEAEFAALRQRIDAYYPEFCAIFASALRDQLGPERLQEMLSGLNGEASQRYLEVAGRIRLALEQSVPTVTQKLTAAAQTALANSALSPALSRGQPRALSLARAAGFEGAFNGLAQAVTRQVLIEQGSNSADPQLLMSQEAQRIQGILLGMLASLHARLFIQHVGEPHAAAVLAELERKPLRDYVSVRCATRPAFDRALVSLTREVL